MQIELRLTVLGTVVLRVMLDATHFTRHFTRFTSRSTSHDHFTQSTSHGLLARPTHTVHSIGLPFVGYWLKVSATACMCASRSLSSSRTPSESRLPGGMMIANVSYSAGLKEAVLRPSG